MDISEKLKQLEHWFIEKAQLLHLAFTKKGKVAPLMPRMGDVYLAKLGINVGHELISCDRYLYFKEKIDT